MSLNNLDMNRLQGMNDSQFKDIVRQITEALGTDKSKADAVVSNADRIRSQLTSISPEDVNRLLGMAGREKSEEIYNILKGK